MSTVLHTRTQAGAFSRAYSGTETRIPWRTYLTAASYAARDAPHFQYPPTGVFQCRARCLYRGTKGEEANMAAERSEAVSIP